MFSPVSVDLYADRPTFTDLPVDVKWKKYQKLSRYHPRNIEKSLCSVLKKTLCGHRTYRVLESVSFLHAYSNYFNIYI